MSGGINDGIAFASEMRSNPTHGQFEADCAALAYEWLPVSPLVVARLLKEYSALPATVQVRAADALHLASAAQHGLKEIHSNDARLLAASSRFGLEGVNIL